MSLWRADFIAWGLALHDAVATKITRINGAVIRSHVLVLSLFRLLSLGLKSFLGGVRAFVVIVILFETVLDRACNFAVENR